MWGYAHYKSKIRLFQLCNYFVNKYHNIPYHGYLFLRLLSENFADCQYLWYKEAHVFWVHRLLDGDILVQGSWPHVSNYKYTHSSTKLWSVFEQNIPSRINKCKFAIKTWQRTPGINKQIGYASSCNELNELGLCTYYKALTVVA